MILATISGELSVILGLLASVFVHVGPSDGPMLLGHRRRGRWAPYLDHLLGTWSNIRLPTSVFISIHQVLIRLKS